MIDFHYWPTPNGWKVSIMLEETGLPYNLCPVNIGAGDQFKPEFLKISPNARMPAIVYHDIQVGYKIGTTWRIYAGVDNITDELPPLGATGTGAGSGIWPVTGRYFYGGVRFRM